MTKGKNFAHYFVYVIKKLYRYNKVLLLQYSFLILITGFLPQIDAFITGKLIDNVLLRVNNATVIQPLELIPLICMVMFLFFSMRFVYDYQSYISQSMELRMQNFRDLLTFEPLVRLPPSVYEDSGFIALKNIIDYNLYKLGNIIFWTISIIGTLFTNLIVIGVFITYSPFILLSAFLSLIFPSIVRLKFGKKVWGIWDSLSDDKIKYSTYKSPLYADEAEKFVETKVFGFGPFLLKKFIGINTKFLEGLIKNEKRRLLFTILARVVEYTFVGIGFWVIFDLVIKGTISVGSLYFLITMYASLRSSTTYTLEQVTNVMSDMPFMKSLYEFLTYEPKYMIKQGSEKIKTAAPSIEFKDVWFKYPGTENWILKGVTFKVDAKTDVAFVGKNGAGKSTIIKLILRVYDANQGEVLINGNNIKDLNTDEYYKQVGILAQDFHKFRFKAGESISIGDVYQTENIEEKVIEAAKKAQADEFIRTYEQGYDTYLTRELKGGTIPSGGQRQRIAIARVFYKNPNLIILDEPTSAIDALAEEQIFSTIKNESKEKTVIIISHRFATVKKADYIYVLDDGVIKEHGTHDQLSISDGLYSKMYTAQRS